MTLYRWTWSRPVEGSPPIKMLEAVEPESPLPIPTDGLFGGAWVNEPEVYDIIPRPPNGWCGIPPCLPKDWALSTE